MANKKSKSKNNNSKKSPKRGNAVVRAPTSISVNAVTPRGGARQEMLMASVNQTSGNFTLHTGNIPWMSGVAKSYQRWNLSDLRVWYEPRVGTSTNGMVHLAHQQDLSDATPTTVAQISAISGATRATVWDTNRKLVVPRRAKAMVYSSPSNFRSMDSSVQNEHCLGRISWIADVDASQFSGTSPAAVGYIWISYIPVLLDPTDPTLND